MSLATAWPAQGKSDDRKSDAQQRDCGRFRNLERALDVVDAKSCRAARVCDVEVERIEPELEPAVDRKRLQSGKEIAGLAGRNSIDADIGARIVSRPVARNTRRAQIGDIRNKERGSVNVVSGRPETTLIRTDPTRAG